MLDGDREGWRPVFEAARAHFAKSDALARSVHANASQYEGDYVQNDGSIAVIAPDARTGALYLDHPTFDAPVRLVDAIRRGWIARR